MSTYATGSLIYSGSFNPLHAGHVHLAMAAQRALECTKRRNVGHEKEIHKSFRGDNTQQKPTIVFEISAINADKPPLSIEDLRWRLSQANID